MTRMADGGDVAVAGTLQDGGVARALQGFLEQEGIASRVNERLHLRGGLLRIGPLPSAAYEILVFRRDLQQARRLMREFLDHPVS